MAYKVTRKKFKELIRNNEKRFREHSKLGFKKLAKAEKAYQKELKLILKKSPQLNLRRV